MDRNEERGKEREKKTSDPFKFRNWFQEKKT